MNYIHMGKDIQVPTAHPRARGEKRPKRQKFPGATRKWQNSKGQTRGAAERNCPETERNEDGSPWPENPLWNAP